MSPSARGLVPGLFLALLAAVGVLAANSHWLLPSLDETGVRVLVAAPELAAGRPPRIPIAAWDAPSPTTGLEGEGKLLALLTAAGVRSGAKPFVAALWVLAGSAALAVLAGAWVAGGVSGTPGAITAGILLLATPLGVEATTALGPDLLVAALVLLLLGTLTYRPGWAVAHGALAALAWLAGPAGLGAVGAVSLWPLLGKEGTGRRMRALGLGLLPSAALVVAALRWPLMAPPSWVPGVEPAERAVSGLASWATVGFEGGAGLLGGALTLAALGTLFVHEARTAPRPSGPVAWTDPAAPDWLALSFRPAAALLALATALGAIGATVGRPLSRPWLPAAFVVAVAAAAAAWRWRAQRRGAAAWIPLVVVGTWAAWGGGQAARTLTLLRATGRGETAKVWVESPVIRWIDNNAPPRLTIYASDPALVVLQSGRAARYLPEPVVLGGAFAAYVAQHGGAVVLTGADATDARVDELRERLGLVEVVRADEGRILIPPTPVP